jgi:Leucine-rich repeat (LRR) protein
VALPKELADLRELRSLTVLNTPIQKFPDFLAACPHLAELVLRGTDIATIPATVEEFRALRRLDLSNNPLSQIAPELGRLSKLQQLILTDDGLSTLPDSLSALHRLGKLVLSGNRFTRAEAARVRRWFRRGVVLVGGRDDAVG